MNIAQDQADVKFSPEMISDWIDILHGSSTGYLHVCSKNNWTGKTFSASPEGVKAATLYAAILDANGAEGIYLRSTTLSRELQPWERGGDEDSSSWPGLFADMDIAGPGHKPTKKLPLPENLEACKAILEEAGLPEPTLWIFSGGGYYPWWLLEQPVPVNDESFQILRDTSKLWQDLIRDAAARLGYHYGPVGDLSRVLRLPGTVNRKVEGKYQLCRILPDEGQGQRFADEELDGFLTYAQKIRDERTPKPEPVAPPVATPRGEGERPGDAYMRSVTWEQVLDGSGWTHMYDRGTEGFYCRPGKDPRNGPSATTNYNGSDLFYVFTTDAEGFEANQSYSKFMVYAILNHGGDTSAAAKALATQGFGDPLPARPTLKPLNLTWEEVSSPVTGSTDDLEPTGEAQPVKVYDPHQFPPTDVGNARRLVNEFGNQFRFSSTEKDWYAWSGKRWTRDSQARINQAAVHITDEILEEAASLKESGQEDAAKEWRKFGLRSQASQRIDGMIKQFRGMQGISIDSSEFDRNRHLVAVDNGVLDLRSGELKAHDPKYMITRLFNAAYDPKATCPEFIKFMAKVLPNENMRRYFQRAMAYTMLGDADQRALFLLYGPTGTGKSQVTDLFTSLFGDYATTAAASTFRVKQSEATYDLHKLKGKRFVTMSETSAEMVMDETLVKRITGMDMVTSRDLYQSYQQWKPECAVWIATNHLPRINSDDGAMWARVKPIPFTQQFSSEDPDSGYVKDIARTVLIHEASGILNWLLEGIKDYREHGLGDPDEVKEGVEAYRQEVDTVAQFVSESEENGVTSHVENLAPSEAVSSTQFYKVYEDWCRLNRYTPLGIRRFTARMRSQGFEQHKYGTMRWTGIKLVGSSAQQGWMVGSSRWE